MLHGFVCMGWKISIQFTAFIKTVFFSQLLHFTTSKMQMWIYVQMCKMARDWNCRSGRTRQTWLWTAECQLNPMSLHSTLVWQSLPIIEHNIDRYGQRSWEWQCPLDKPHDEVSTLDWVIQNETSEDNWRRSCQAQCPIFHSRHWPRLGKITQSNSSFPDPQVDFYASSHSTKDEHHKNWTSIETFYHLFHTVQCHPRKRLLLQPFVYLWSQDTAAIASASPVFT